MPVQCLCYSYTPCCGGHPIYLARFDAGGSGVIFPDPPGVPHVWQYTGALPYTDHLGHSLMPGECYYISFFTINLADGATCNPPYLLPSPTIANFSPTSHMLCSDAAEDSKCGCATPYILTSCCPGSEPVIYNITNYDGSIVDGNVYTAVLDPNDISTASCFLFEATTVEDPSLLPTLDISFIDTGASTTCETSICFLLCQPCICQTFTDDPNVPGSNGLYAVVTCDLRTASIFGSGVYSTPTPVIQYQGDPTLYPLTEGICLRYWVEQTTGLLRTSSGECEIVYWDTEGSEINCPTYYKIVNCQDENEFYCVTNDLSTEYSSNLVLTVEGETFADKCWRIEETLPCPQTITISFSITHADCEECLEKIVGNYELINCNDNSVIIYTSTNLQDYAGSYITLVEYPEDCWFVQALPSSIPSDIPVTFNQQFPDCELCTGPQYLLEDCDIDNPDPNIITNTDLSAYVGQVVTLLNCPDKCWIVSETDPIPTPQLVNVTASHVDCEACFPIPPIPDPVVYKYKSITPGYNTPGCEPDKFERILCNFSESMYRQIMVDAYGITPCCGEDDIQYEIRYELIKLKAIQDPDYNCKLTSSCECTTSTVGLTPCVITCNRYILTIQSLTGTSFTYNNCQGEQQTLVIPQGKEPIQYTICSRAGQTFVAPPGTVVFTSEETSINCTE